MDIYSYLKKDHREVGALMDQVLEAKDAARREELFKEISEKLTLHAEAEEATFYAALEEDEETEEKTDYLQEDQDEIKEYLEKLSSLSADSQKWLELFGEFKHAVEHHVKDEEERMFKKARDVIDDEQAEELGEEMDRIKHEAMEDAA